MTEHITDNEKGLTSIHVGDADQVAALIEEMKAMVGRLTRETRALREDVARLKTATSTAETSAPRPRAAAPDAQH